MKQQILVIHPEGNIFNNPNLYEILIFLNKYFQTSVLIPKLEINQDNKQNNSPCKIIEYSNIYNEYNLLADDNILNDFIERYSLNTYTFTIGIDRLGIYLAYILYSKFNINYGYISYEIFFEKESSKEFKLIEKISCQYTNFVIVQDRIRAHNLQIENNIDSNKMIYIPVAGSKEYPYKKNYFIYDLLNISRSKKMLIYIGSIDYWSCFNSIFKENLIPEDWVFIIHDRYGSSKEKLTAIEPNLPSNIYFLDITLCTNHDMKKILHSADLGLALYCPDYKSIFTGKNILDIGLSSGKISTYLQNGLPIITSDNLILREYYKKYHFGYIINKVSELEMILSNYEHNSKFHQDSINFFNKELSFKNYETTILNLLRSTLKKDVKSSLTLSKNKNLIGSLKYISTTYNKIDFSKKFNCLFIQIQKLKKENQKYIIYGNGTLGKTIKLLLDEKIEHVDIAEKNNHPIKLLNMKYDKIIISVLGRENEIVEYLTKEIGINKNRIITLEI
ncbi:hypothetical protein [Halarcobacter sp.]|uniref:hypothetical protein n=1 Tax=Halarcobacter sp. TaxID=2321133 RepID=UPI0029F49F65|nr:hypothetical protein [Halarcobacter sp.]